MANPLARWQTAVSAVNAGTRNATLLFVGDSLTAGYASTGNGMAANAKSNAIPTKIAAGMRTVQASNGNFFSDNNASSFGSTIAAYDNRISTGTTWIAGQLSVKMLGGYWTAQNVTDTVDYFGFQPTQRFNRFRIFYSLYNGGPTISVNVDGGTALGTINTNNGAGFQFRSADYSTTLGTHQIRFNSTGANGFIGGMLTWNDAVKQVHVINAGQSGAYALDMADTTDEWSGTRALTFLAPDLTVICLGTNDRKDGRTLGEFNTAMQAIITAAKISGDVLLCVPPYTNTAQWAGATLPVQNSFNQAIRDLAAANNCALLDMTTRANWTSWAASNAAGYADADGLHFTNAGYANWAAAYLALIDVNVSSNTGGGARRSKSDEDAEFWAAYETFISEQPAVLPKAERPTVGEVKKAVKAVEKVAPEIAKAATAPAMRDNETVDWQRMSARVEAKALVALERHVREIEEEEEIAILLLALRRHEQQKHQLGMHRQSGSSDNSVQLAEALKMLAEAHSRPKKVRKGPDGAWVVEAS